MSEINVSPIDGVHVLLVNGFRISIEPECTSEGVTGLAYIVSRKGRYIYTYKSLQQAVAWCSD